MGLEINCILCIVWLHHENYFNFNAGIKTIQSSSKKPTVYCKVITCFQRLLTAYLGISNLNAWFGKYQSLIMKGWLHFIMTKRQNIYVLISSCNYYI